MEAAPALDGHPSAPTATARVAVVGAGISGLVAASILAERGAHVLVFDLGRGPGGRMSQRRESITVPPRVSSAESAVDLPNLEARFDHGAQYFTINDPNVLTFLEQRFGGTGTGALAEWKGRFGTWDAEKGKFIPEEGEDAGKVQEEGNFGIKKRFVGVPGMNALCQTLLLPSPMASAVNVNVRFGVQVARANLLEHKNPAGVSDVDQGTPLSPSWELFSSSGDSLGCFDGLVIAAAYRTMPVVLPDLPSLAQVRQGLAEVRASPRFAMMLAFAEPLSHVAFDGVDVVGSDVVGWIGRDSSKPGRVRREEGGYHEEQYAECWVVHSTAHYASSLLASAPPGRPSPELLARVADDMWRAVKPVLLGGSGRGGGQSVGGVEGGEGLEPVLRKVHRWGGAFPVAGVAAAGEKCLWSEGGRVAACGDFCVGGPVRGLVEGAVASGMEAGRKLVGGLVESAVISGMEVGRKLGDALRLRRSALPTVQAALGSHAPAPALHMLAAQGLLTRQRLPESAFEAPEKPPVVAQGLFSEEKMPELTQASAVQMLRGEGVEAGSMGEGELARLVAQGGRREAEVLGGVESGMEEAASWPGMEARFPVLSALIRFEERFGIGSSSWEEVRALGLWERAALEILAEARAGPQRFRGEMARPYHRVLMALVLRGWDDEIAQVRAWMQQDGVPLAPSFPALLARLRHVGQSTPPAASHVPLLSMLTNSPAVPKANACFSRLSADKAKEFSKKFSLRLHNTWDEQWPDIISIALLIVENSRAKTTAEAVPDNTAGSADPASKTPGKLSDLTKALPTEAEVTAGSSGLSIEEKLKAMATVVPDESFIEDDSDEELEFDATKDSVSRLRFTAILLLPVILSQEIKSVILTVRTLMKRVCSRIDRALISQSLLSHLELASHIMPADPISDHSFAVRVAFRMKTKVQAGPGLWRLPAHMVGKPGVRKIIEVVETQAAKHGDSFELLISRLNAGLKAYAKEERKRIRATIQHLQCVVASLKQAWMRDPSCDRTKKLLDERELQLKSYQQVRQERLHEMAGLEAEVKGEVAFTFGADKQRTVSDWSPEAAKTLSQAAVVSLEADWSEDEVKRAFRSLANNKAPGKDGLPKELFEAHWDVLGKHFMKLVADFSESAVLPTSAKDAVTILLHKKGGRDQIENYRPITLLSSVYKVLAWVVADRIKKVLHEVISTEQYGFLPGRRLSDAVGLVADVIEAAKHKDEDWYILLVDFKKAFDSVSRSFLFGVLEKMGFPHRSIRWIQGLHENTTTSLLINGWMGDAVEVVSGVRQGCPLAPYLFLCAVEPLAQDAASRNLGLTGEGRRLAYLGYADDTTLLLEGDAQIEEAEKLLEKFEGDSGLATNKGKSVVLPLGKNLNKQPWKTDGFKWAKADDAERLLGVWVTPAGSCEPTWERAFAQIKEKLILWEAQHLTTGARAAVINCYISPIVFFQAQVYPPPVGIWGRIIKLVHNFMSGNKASTDKGFIL
ncbi:unnamed protein product [Closterium sp. Yama58-4]|nr:unnamed protein product [Closterium sp. Yama58-4]